MAAETLNLTLQMDAHISFSILDDAGAKRPLSEAEANTLVTVIHRLAPESLVPVGGVISGVRVECRRIVAINRGTASALACRIGRTQLQDETFGYE